MRFLCAQILFCLSLWSAAVADIAECRRAPDADCLADVGFELAMSTDSLPRLTQAPKLLAQMDRVDEAYALHFRSQALNGVTDEQAKRLADVILGDFNFARDLLSGNEPNNTSDASAALSRIAGMSVGGSTLGLFVTRDVRKIDVIESFARKASGSRAELLRVAELLVWIEADELALEVVDRLPVDDTSSSVPSKRLIQLIGTERAISILDGMQDVPPFYYLRVAELANDPEEARRMFRAVEVKIDASESQRTAAMVDYIIVASRRGDADIANAMLERLREEVTMSESDTGELLGLALALHVTNADRKDVRKVLREVDRRIPESSEFVVPQLHGSLANHYLRLGDHEIALRHFWETEPGILDWIRFLSSDSLSNSQRIMHFDRVKRRLTPDEIMAIEAGLTARLSRTNRTSEERNWAGDTVRTSLAGTSPSDPLQQGYFFDRLVLAAHQLDDEELVSKVLKVSSDTALDSGEFRPIIQAAHQYHRAELWRTGMVDQKSK